MAVNCLQSKRVRACIFGLCLLAGFGLGVLLLGGCSENAANARAFSGTILEVDEERSAVRVRVNSGADFLADPEVWASVRRGDLANAGPGEEIRAFLFDSEDGDPAYRLERVWPAGGDSGRVVEAINRRLRQDTVLRGEGAYLLEGETLPRFALYDQSGKLARHDRFAGKRVVMNFIFTRCMDPEMCPAATERMRQLQRAANEAGVERFELVSVTLDPEYDTPGVLWEYATDRGIDLENFSFLTGPERAVRDLMTQIGILSYPDDEQYFTHTMATLMIDEDGSLVHRVDGSRWLVSDFLNRLKEEDA